MKSPGARSKLFSARQGVRMAKSNTLSFLKAAAALAEIGKNFYTRGWVLGTSGNFSAVTSHEPLRLAITSTGLDKGNLTPAQFFTHTRSGAPCFPGRTHLTAASPWKDTKC